MDAEKQVLVEIKRLRKELSEAAGSLQMGVADRSFREQLQGTQTEPTTVYEKIAAILVKQEKCGCECCIDGARMYADFQEGLDSLQMNLGVGASEQVPRSSSNSAPPEDVSEGFSVGGPQRS